MSRLLLLPLFLTVRVVTFGYHHMVAFGFWVSSSKMPKAPGTGLPTSVEQSIIKYVPSTASRFAGDNFRSPTKPV